MITGAAGSVRQPVPPGAATARTIPPAVRGQKATSAPGAPTTVPPTVPPTVPRLGAGLVTLAAERTPDRSPGPLWG